MGELKASPRPHAQGETVLHFNNTRNAKGQREITGETINGLILLCFSKTMIRVREDIS